MPGGKLSGREEKQPTVMLISFSGSSEVVIDLLDCEVLNNKAPLPDMQKA